MRSTSLRAAVPLVLALLSGCGAAPADGLVGELARVADGGREPGPRLSISSVGRCSELDDAPRPCSARVAGLRERRARDVAARAGAALRARVDADALHAAGLVDLLWSDSAGKSLDRSIESLQAAARISESPAPVLADLAAAFLVRAERTGGARDLFEAAEAASDALVADSASVAARFNLALALERIGLVETAAEAWDAYLALDSASPWGARARDRSAALREPPPPLPPLGVPADAEAFAAASPQEALYRGLDVVLAEWGAAVRAGDAARAMERLAMAAALGAALVRRGGDASLADAVGAIRRVADDREATMRLAEGHARYGEGRRLYREARYTDAAEALGGLTKRTTGSDALRGWATLFRGAALAQSGRVMDGAPLIAGVAAGADSARHPALAGRARWSVGTLELREGRYEESLVSYRAASRLLRRAGEPEHIGGVAYLRSRAELDLGDRTAALASLVDALDMLRPYRVSVWLHNALALTGAMATDEGWAGAALATHGEDVRVTDGMQIPAYAAEARLQRALARAASGDLAGAAVDVDSGARWVRDVADAGAREFLTADLMLARGAILAQANPSRAVAPLDTAIEYFSDLPLVLRVVPTLALRANVRLAQSDESGAEADLRRVLDLLDAASSRVTQATMRAAMADAAAPTTDRLVSLLVARGNGGAALAALERSRPSGGGLSTDTIAAPHGAIAATYALIGDTLFVWRLREDEIRLTRTLVGRDRLSRTVSRVRTALEGSLGTEVTADLEALHQWLIAPLELGTGETELVVVADGEISAVPFAALRNATSGQYLVEERPVRFAASLAEARKVWRGTPGEGALLIADPAFDRAAHPELERLRGAEAEVGAIAAGYPDAVVLRGAGAQLDAVRSALPGVSVVHYAGHATFDERRPERSFLLLAGRGGRLSADDLGRMDLRSVRVVVLSACRTLPGRDGRSGGLAGLATALDAAGTGGVLGSLWRVDDELTRALMVRFHRAFRASSDPAGALRAAQLALLRSSDPALRSPAAWAGFQYAGH